MKLEEILHNLSTCLGRGIRNIMLGGAGLTLLLSTFGCGPYPSAKILLHLLSDRHPVSYEVRNEWPDIFDHVYEDFFSLNLGNPILYFSNYSDNRRTDLDYEDAAIEMETLETKLIEAELEVFGHLTSKDSLWLGFETKDKRRLMGKILNKSYLPLLHDYITKTTTYTDARQIIGDYIAEAKALGRKFIVKKDQYLRGNILWGLQPDYFIFDKTNLQTRIFFVDPLVGSDDIKEEMQKDHKGLKIYAYCSNECPKYVFDTLGRYGKPAIPFSMDKELRK